MNVKESYCHVCVEASNEDEAYMKVQLSTLAKTMMRLRLKKKGQKFRPNF